MGGKFASSCESACEGAADASETGGALAYSARCDPPLSKSRGGDAPHLQEREEKTKCKTTEFK